MNYHSAQVNQSATKQIWNIYSLCIMYIYPRLFVIYFRVFFLMITNKWLSNNSFKKVIYCFWKKFLIYKCVILNHLYLLYFPSSNKIRKNVSSKNYIIKKIYIYRTDLGSVPFNIFSDEKMLFFNSWSIFPYIGPILLEMRRLDLVRIKRRKIYFWIFF